MEESDCSDQQSFSSNLSRSLHQQVSNQQQPSSKQNSQKRQIDNLYENLCEKKIQPKAWLKQVKSDKNLHFCSHHEASVASKTNNKTQKNNKSFQDEIVLSNYRQLLRNHFQSGHEKDLDFRELRQKYKEQEQQNCRILQENQKLKRQMLKMIKIRKEQQQKIKAYSTDLKKLNRRYDNLLKESKAKQATLNTQMKRLKEESTNYANLITALKQSIHILKGKKVKDLEHIWIEWKQIFQLASLQQCKVFKKSKN